MKLSNFTQGRDNNFNLIRIIAAFSVLITHSFALAIGSGNAEPFRTSLGMTMGSVAVDVFFVTSGFLVTASLITRQSATEFIWARFLRIFPALLVMLVLTVFGIGVFFTTMPIDAYLRDSGVYFYFFKCLTLITGVIYTLPGVFYENPYKSAFNGSLWTMPYEIRMYLILIALWISLRVAKEAKLKAFMLTIVASAVVAGCLVLAHYLLGSSSKTSVKLFFMFFSGAAFYVLKDRISLSHMFFLLAMLMLVFAALTNQLLFSIVYTLTIAYILFYLAYIPSGVVRKYNKVGDYSYGIYIYGFPIQQSVAALVPGVSVGELLILSSTATLLLAVLSWHVVERRFLSIKGLCVNTTERVFLFVLKGKGRRPI